MSLTDRHRSGKVDIRMLTLLSQNYGGRVSDSNLSFARHFLAKGTARDTTAASKPAGCGYRLKILPVVRLINQSHYRRIRNMP